MSKRQVQTRFLLFDGTVRMLPKNKTYTPAQYLTLEEMALEKHEYLDGRMRQLTPSSANHSLIKGNIVMALGGFCKRRRYEILATGMRLRVTRDQFFTYPDVMLFRGRVELLEGRDDVVVNPRLIVEVASPASRVYDRGRKFDLYRAIATLQDYIVIDEQRPQVEYLHRLADDTWELEEYGEMKDIVKFHAITFALPIAEIYDMVDWAALPRKRTRRKP